MALGQFSKNVNQHSVLTRDEEEALYPTLATSMEARNKLIQANLRIALKLANQYYRMYSPQYDLEELVGEANVGLMIAAERFDPTLKRRFSGYAEIWIRQVLGKYCLENRSIVRIPSSSMSKHFKVTKLLANHTLEEIAEILQTPLATVKELAELNTHDVSIHNDSDDEYAEHAYHQDIFEALVQEDDELIEGYSKEDMISALKNACHSLQLDTQQTTYVYSMCGLSHSYKVKELAEISDCSVDSVRTLKTKTINKLNHLLTSGI